MRILVVEDETLLREGLTDLLSGAGHTVGAVGDGQAAAERGTAEAWDLVLLDLMLPKLDGIEVCRRLQRNPRTRNVAILPVTGFEAEAVRSRVVELGIPEVLEKGADVRAFRESLVAAVSRLLDLEPAVARKAAAP